MSLRGLALPAVRLAGGYFATRARYDVAWGDLLMVLMTPYGSRPGQRDYGCAIHDLVMAQTTEPLEAMASDYVRRAVRAWAPHLNIHNVTAAVEGTTLVVTVTFGLNSESTTETRQVPIPMGNYLGAI